MDTGKHDMAPDAGPAPRPTESELATLQKEYEQVNGNFRQLADIRFKLLAFVPALGGAANYVLTEGVLNADQQKAIHWGLALLAGIVGFLVTLAVVLYDQRNSQLYNSLLGRAKRLEGMLGLPHSVRPCELGGQFAERPEASRRLLGILLAKHDPALAIIYGSILGSWFFPIVYSALVPLGVAEDPRKIYALGSAAVVGAVFWFDLMRLDERGRNAQARNKMTQMENPPRRSVQVRGVTRVSMVGQALCFRLLSRGSESSPDQHAMAAGIEAVSFGDGMA
jgi:hypothetical protein